MAVLPALALLAAAPAPILVDPMEDAASWPAKASDSVTVSGSAVPGSVGRAAELRYDFGRVSGYAYMRRPVALELPRNFEIRFRINGSGGRNDLQMKLTHGDNVWWKAWRNFRPPADWQDVVVPAGEIGFAWGPTDDKILRRADGIEFVVARNRDGGAGHIAIDELRIVPLAGAPVAARPAEESANDRIAALAKASPRGTFPRAFLGEQPYWTLAGSDGGKIAALISEDAAIEPAKGSYSIEPMVMDAGKRFDWARVRQGQSLDDGKFPIPTVTWTAPGFSLDTTLLADSAGRAVLARYALTNTAGEQRTFELRLGIRPWQVNPPAQFLAQQGGASPISRIVREHNRLAITQPQTEGDAAVTRTLIASRRPNSATIGALPGKDMATADLVYRFNLAPGASDQIVLSMAGSGASPSWEDSLAATQAHWREVLGRVTVRVPPGKQAVADTLATAFAHILTSRDGPMLKPGTRSYDRAWIRDGAMMSEALLRMGRSDVARAFADWYRPNLFDSGKVPCCVDFRGADPVPENDSHGEYIFMVSQLYRFTGDRAALTRDWPAVHAATRYMDQLRLSERTPANLAPERRMLYGLMPPSISHEGYSAKPQYSLWDDFWALRGYRDAAEIARTLGKPQAADIAASRDQFAADLHAAVLAARDHWKIDFIPGATSLGDFDATSTTIALDPGNEQSRLNPKMLEATFQRYWSEFQTRAAGTRQWKDYTPYETRTIGSFVRLGWRDRIDPLLDFFMASRRPAAWNQWAEVVGRQPREVRFIGDMPHAWVASDFVRGVLDMFAWERREDSALVLGGGLAASWLAGEGSGITGLATPFGQLAFSIRGNDRHLTATIGDQARPPGGFVLHWPYPTRPPTARVNGREVPWRNGALDIAATGKLIRIEVGQSTGTQE
ncbi:MAG: discoidin domain-containing protein [Sphingomicrobium sp.]